MHLLLLAAALPPLAAQNVALLKPAKKPKLPALKRSRSSFASVPKRLVNRRMKVASARMQAPRRAALNAKKLNAARHRSSWVLLSCILSLNSKRIPRLKTKVAATSCLLKVIACSLILASSMRSALLNRWKVQRRQRWVIILKRPPFRLI